MLPAYLLDDAFSDYVVGQAAEGLRADDVVGSFLDQLQHFPGQEPSFPGLVAQGNDVPGHFAQFPDMVGRGKAFRAGQGFPAGFADMLQIIDYDIADPRGPFAGIVVFRLEVLIVKTVEEEIHHFGLNRFRAFPLEKLNQVVVGGGQELDQDLSHDADSWFFLIRDGKDIKLMHDLPAQCIEAPGGSAAGRQEIDAFFFQPFMQPVGASLFLLVGADPVETFHEQIAELYCVKHAKEQGQVHLESRIGLQPLYGSGDDRHMVKTCLFQRAAEESHIVGGPAAAACLGHDDGGAAQVIFAAGKLRHHLTDDNEGRVAGVIVDIFQSQVHCLVFRRVYHHKAVAGRIESRSHDVEMDRTHLRAEDRIGLPHVLCEDNRLNSGGVYLTRCFVRIADADGGDQGADPDPGGSQVAHFVDLQAGIDLA